MRIHSNTITVSDVYAAAREAGVYFADESPTEHGSRSHERSFNCVMRGDSNRNPNFGAARVDRFGQTEKAATWDQWGVFFAAMFRRDPAMVCGSAGRPTYTDVDDFNYQTCDRFAKPGFPADAHGDHNFQWDSATFTQRCTKCRASKARSERGLTRS